MKTTSRSNALAAGATRFFTGKPCRYGHIAERLVSNYRCIVCSGNAYKKTFPPGVRSEYQRQYHADNKEQENARSRRHRAKNAEDSCQRVRQWMADNPEKRRSNRRSYRARKLAADGHHNAADIVTLFDRQQGRCAACLCDITAGYDVDHIVPLSRGGSNWPENLQLLCSQCNRSKNDRTMEEWRGRSSA